MDQSTHPNRLLYMPSNAWRAAHAKVKLAQARFAPVQAALSQAERVYFAQERENCHNAQAHEIELVKARLEQAYEDERVSGAALDKAAKRLCRTRAPDIAALIEKIQLLTRLGCDDSLADWIVSDLRHLQAGPRRD
jgi:hypothetical protein